MKILLSIAVLLFGTLIMTGCQNSGGSRSASYSGGSDGIYFDQDYPYNQKQASKANNQSTRLAARKHDIDVAQH